MAQDGIVIFGGVGYIGSNLSVGLRLDYKIIIVDKSPKPTWFDDLMPSDAEYHQIDLTKTPDSQTVINGAKYAIILAALKDVVEGEQLPYDYTRDNLNITINSLQYCDFWGIKNILFASSCAVYHTASSCAQPRHCFNENDTKNGELPIGVYGYTKRASEDIVTVLAGNKPDIRVVMLRYSNPLASVAEHPLFPQAGVATVLAKRPPVFEQRGDGLRDYINIRDLVEMHRLLIENWEQKVPANSAPMVLNMGTGYTTKTSEIVEMFKSLNKEEGKDYDLQVKLVDRPCFEAMAGCTDMTKFKLMFPEWNPSYSVKESVRDYVHRYLKSSFIIIVGSH